MTAGAMYVAWSNIGHALSTIGPLNTFQIVITNGQDPVVAEGNNVSFCFKSIQWAGSTAQDPGSTLPATIGANLGDAVHYVQLGRFHEAAQGWNGRFVISGPDWLNGRHLAFNVAPADPPAFFSTTECDTVEVMAGTTGHYGIIAHRGGPAPPLSATSICPGISSYAFVDEDVEGADLITASFTPTDDEAGVHPMYFQAANGMTPVAITVRYVKVLTPVGQLEATRPPEISIFPNPSSGHVWIAWSGEPPQEVHVTAADGRILQYFRPSGRKMQLQTGQWPPGLYSVQCIFRQVVSATRLVVAED